MRLNRGEILTIVIEGLCAIIGGIGGSILNSGVQATVGAQDSSEMADILNAKLKGGKK